MTTTLTADEIVLLVLMDQWMDCTWYAPTIEQVNYIINIIQQTGANVNSTTLNNLIERGHVTIGFDAPDGSDTKLYCANHQLAIDSLIENDDAYTIYLKVCAQIEQRTQLASRA